MALVDLKKNSGLSLSFDGSELLLQENGLTYLEKEVVTIHDIRPQLLNPELTCPEIFNYNFRAIDRKNILRKKGLRMDFLILPSNLAGIEYVKTRGFRINKYPVLVDSINGFITLLIVKPSSDHSPDFPVKAGVVKVKKGEKYVIPPKSEFVVVNTRQPTCVLAMLYCNRLRMEQIYDETKGAPSYIIRKNARQEVVQNPSFRSVKKVRFKKPEQIYKEFNLTARTPVFKQILRKFQRFKWLSNGQEIDWNKLLVTK